MFSGSPLDSVYKKWTTALQELIGELFKQYEITDGPYKLSLAKT